MTQFLNKILLFKFNLLHLCNTVNSLKPPLPIEFGTVPYYCLSLCFSLLHWNLEHDIIKANKVVMELKKVAYIFNLYMHGIRWSSCIVLLFVCSSCIYGSWERIYDEVSDHFPFVSYKTFFMFYK